MVELRSIRFTSNHAGDISVLADYLRIYGCLLIEGYGEQEDRSGKCLPHLTVSWDPYVTGVSILWTGDDGNWSHKETMRPVSFQETEENRRRRILRLAFHRLLEAESGLRDALQALPSPWGVLTGVRPSKMLQRFFDQGISDPVIHSILEGEFGMEQGRIRLLLDVCHAQRPFLPSIGEGRKKISIYLGYPFCPSRCEYCSFPGYDAKRWRKWQEACCQAMEKELRQMGEAASGMGLQVETFYFGGGTPTCMSPEAMDRLLTTLSENFSLTPGLEYTIEAGRPETITEDMLEVLASHPVNRICVNPQSMNQATLDRIGRLHEAQTVVEAITRVREKRKDWRINCDLILGLPGEGLGEISESLRRILAIKPENVTLHGLAIKRGSAYKEGKESLPDRLLGLEMIELSRDMMSEAGYMPYYLYRQKDSLAGGENVGYSLPGKECLYNILMIEERQTILGLGAGAGSKFLRPGDWALDNVYNPKDLIQYIQRVDDSIQRKVDKLALLG
jgi:oxygen-independent coproporphyrinogen-3 oxidase